MLQMPNVRSDDSTIEADLEQDCKCPEQRWYIIIHVRVRLLRDKVQREQNSVCFCV